MASAGITASSSPKQPAGVFNGDVRINNTLRVSQDIHVGRNVLVKGDITLENEDCAEQFNVSEGVTSLPGTVMVLNDEGLLRPSRLAYDKRVAGVISGAGSHKPVFG